MRGNDHRPRVQILDKRCGIPYAYNDEKLFNNKENSKNNICRGISDFGISDGPSWIVNDKKVLCFDGYFIESVVDNPDIKYRSRNCKLMFYLEDGTIHVLEPRMKNSSLAQGTIVKRSKMLKPPPNDKEFYSIYDLNIGEVINICGRCIKLVSCDKFTQNYMRRIGVNLGYPVEPPLDPKELTQILGSQRKGKGYYHSSDNSNQFFDHNKHILRFDCYWDNDDLPNDPRAMTLYYYLEDDTIEITENLMRNCGRDSKLFIKRQKLPKRFISCGLNLAGHLSDPGYLNVIKTAKSQHKIIDSLSDSTVNFECYKDHDLTLGQYINVLGRKFMLCDCDGFTKEYYRVKYGITNFNSINISKFWKQGEYIIRSIPPYNGWGSEEDSMLNCLSINPSEVIKSAKHFMTTSRTIDDLKMLTFMGIIHNPGTTFDKERRFIFSFRTEDDKLIVSEQTHEKPGSHFEPFLNRDIYKKPKQTRKDENVPEYYEANDFYIGALIALKGLVFEIILSDDYTLKYMENRAHAFPHSSLERILAKLRKYLMNSKADVEYFFKNEDPFNTGHVNYTSMKLFQTTFANNFLVNQDIVTLSRLYKDKSFKTAENLNRSIATIRHKLRIENYMDYFLIKEHWYRISPNSTSMHISKARSVLKGLQFPVSDEMLCDILKLSKINNTDNIDLCTLLDIIEWQKFQPDYFLKVGQFLECKDSILSIEKFKLSESFPEKTFNIDTILWKDLFKDIYHSPKSSKAHPSTQRLMLSATCKETYE